MAADSVRVLDRLQNAIHDDRSTMVEMSVAGLATPFPPDRKGVVVVRAELHLDPNERLAWPVGKTTVEFPDLAAQMLAPVGKGIRLRLDAGAAW